ncbi:MAG: hypothetical protein BGO98_19165 [Myxococcales bacterium 68-20]|nr:MAG: hypothetical protein BGO98_19165 [Myxococcales bacterium 68-20]
MLATLDVLRDVPRGLRAPHDRATALHRDLGLRDDAGRRIDSRCPCSRRSTSADVPGLVGGGQRCAGCLESPTVSRKTCPAVAAVDGVRMSMPARCG